MYYEEKVIDGILCCRSTPNSEFTPMSKVALTELVLSLRDKLEQLQGILA